MSFYRPDTRPASLFRRYHRHARKRHPYLQAVALSVILPVAMLLTRVKVAGREHIPEGGFICAANHPSVVDPVFLALPIRRRMHFMGKSDIFKGFWGWLFTRVGAFPVIRGTWDEEAFKTAQEILEKGRVLVIFPEGGCSPPEGGYRPARPGIGQVALATGVPILPVHLKGVRRFRYKPWSWPKIEVTIGAPIPTEPAEPTRENTQAVAEEALAAIIRLGQFPQPS